MVVMRGIAVICVLLAISAYTNCRPVFLDFCNRPDPWPLDVIHPTLFVFTRSNTYRAKIEHVTDLAILIDHLENEGFLSVNRQVVFITHGFFGWKPWANWIKRTKEAILKVDDSTVFLLDWSKGADVVYNYPQAASNTQTMADLISRLAMTILYSKTFKGDPDLLYLHCIGHSLGAHICGQAGRDALVFDRASGLDPAGPGFDACPDHLHIDQDSAACVDNIHTDGSKEGHWLPIIPNFGTLQTWGHVDFYPNGGKNQPGCWSNNVPPCSHSAAIIYFMSSLEHGPKWCMAEGTCSDTSRLPGSCSSNVSQPLGYYSSCHRSYTGRIGGSFYISTGRDETNC